MEAERTRRKSRDAHSLALNGRWTDGGSGRAYTAVAGRLCATSEGCDHDGGEDTRGSKRLQNDPVSTALRVLVYINIYEFDTLYYTVRVT